MELTFPPFEEKEERTPLYRPRVAITHGDPNGIGPEVVLKALADQRVTRYFEPVLVGAAHVFRRHVHQYGMSSVKLQVAGGMSAKLRKGHTRVIDTLPGRKARLAVGRTTREGGHLAMEAIRVATRLAMEEEVDAVVTAPISKRAIALAEYEFPGHTEYLAEQTGAKNQMMVMVADVLRVALATIHTPLQHVVGLLSTARVHQCIVRLGRSLTEDFGISRPKIAVLGLNPHAGEGGVLGSEENEVITPAIQRSCREGWLSLGPFPADGFFGATSYRQYDAVLAMYHDQGLVPFKALTFGRGVNFTAGLPIVRTSPDHGTAFDIAGKGVASPRSLLRAILLAVDIVRQRRSGREESH